MTFGWKKMGYGSEALRTSFLIIFVFLSLQRTRILTAEALLNGAGSFHFHGLSKMYFMEENVQENENHVKKISGQDANEEKDALIVEKFRALLGLKSFHTTGDSLFVSPSPSPLPSIGAEAPAPLPIPPLVHARLHHPLHHSHLKPLPHKIQDEDRGRARRILVAALVSVGVATGICAIGLFWVCKKCRNHRKKPKRTMPLYSKIKGIKGDSQNSSSKVSVNSGLDLFYLNAIGTDIEQHNCSPKQTSEAVNSTSNSNHSTPKCSIYEKTEANKEVTSSDNGSSSCRMEIPSVHEYVESVKYDSESESDGGNSFLGDKTISMENHSSDHESFHSFVDSRFSNVRASNASADCLCETSSPLSSQASRSRPSLVDSSYTPVPSTHQIPCSPQSSIPYTQSPHVPERKEQKIETLLQSPQPLVVPSPPPPPPPPIPPSQPMPLFALHSLSRTPSQSPRSTFHNLSSPTPINSGCFSGTSQKRENGSPSPSQSNRTESPPTPNIPPPPRPPPFLNGNNNNNGKTPPPPPAQLPQFTPRSKDGAPLPKLKPLHWDKVRAAPDRTMVWDKIRSSSFELDEEMIESLFGYNLQNSMKNDETKSKTPSPSKHVLEPKRLQNIAILSKALNVTAEQVCESLIQGKGLSLQQLEALVKMAPTKEEEAKLSSYKGDINELGSAERFVRTTLSVPLAFQRVEAMLYRETFEDEVVHLRNSFSMLEEACKELRSSRLFLKLLETVLKTGNRMNVGTIRGGARAFKLDALLKLADVKGTDGKTTLLHFVVQEIVRSEGIRVSDSIMGKINQRNKNRTEEEQEEDYRRMGLELVSGLSTELYNVKKTATIDLDVLASSVSNLSDGAAKLEHLVQNEDEKGDNFVSSIKSFLNYAGKVLKELQGDEDRVLARVKEITEYFHGDVSKEDGNPLRIFVIVRDFLGMLDNVCKELRRSKVPRSPNPLAPFR
ncbi:hypothetical protein L6164_035016 [Bauhinia variegata]|uniref:Uncharacterized protein n=1 Tax=Bauhinia variegata TaxID=167791 RepID=A0ACB9KXA0_BAUVA|nr:hypothetical protein L6164_035016 [Bauhinia variegata]